MKPFHSVITPFPICLGTATFGTSEISEDTSFTLMDAYAENGGNFIDTAHIYAAWLPGSWGASERTVGAWLKTRRVRDTMILSTKGAHPPMDHMEIGRCTEKDIRRDLEESLERLAVEVVDLYWLHRDDERVPVEEIVDIMAALVQEGLIRHYGGSNWSCSRIEAANAYAARKGVSGFAASQPGWALADRAPGPAPVGGMRYLEESERQWHNRTGLPLLAYSAQARGYFGRANTVWAENGFQGTVPCGSEYDSPQSRQRFVKAITLAKKKDCTPGQVALAYLIQQSFPVYPIIGTGKLEHLKEAMNAVTIHLSAEESLFLRTHDYT